MAKLFNLDQLPPMQTIDKHHQDPDFLYHELIATRELCQNLNKVMECSTDGLFVTDKNAIMLWINQAYEVITGVRREELIGRSAQIMADHYSFRAVCAVMCARQKKSVTLEQTLKNSKRKVLVSCRPVFDASGEISIIVGVLRDITELDSLKMTLSQAEEMGNQYRAAYDTLKSQLRAFPDIIAEDKKMVDTLYLARRVSATNVPVLLIGESGSGKEEIARFIYRNSDRKDAPFVTINCGAIPPSLMESELFGYEKGAFTGASQRGKPGLLEIATTGTVFLDEIGELPLEMQVKLLRVLQSQEVTRIGGVEPIHLDIRLISATNCDLEEMVNKKLFRLDLFYRINTMTVRIPPLRERPGDIKPLADAFLAEANQKFGVHKRISPLGFRCLYDYKWPGNVRELKNLIDRVSISTEDDIIVESDLQRILFPAKQENHFLNQRYSLKTELEKIESKHLEDAYRTYGSVRKAAEMLNMSPSTFQRRRTELRQKYGVSTPDLQTL